MRPAIFVVACGLGHRGRRTIAVAARSAPPVFAHHSRCRYFATSVSRRIGASPWLGAGPTQSGRAHPFRPWPAKPRARCRPTTASSSPRHESTRAIASARQCIRTQRCPERHHLPQTLTFDTAQSPCSRRQRPFPFTCSSARHPVNAHSEGHPTRIASKLRAPRCAPAKPHLNALQRGFPSVFRYLASPSPSDGGPRIPPESSHLMRKPLSPLPWTEQWRSPPEKPHPSARLPTRARLTMLVS